MSQHPPGFTRYIGFDERTDERLFAVKSGPSLPPPIPHARGIAKVPEMLVLIARLAGTIKALDEDYDLRSEYVAARTLLQEIEGETL